MIIIIVLISLFLSSWWLLNGNMLFHTDIARDFFLMKDIVVNKHLTLIGARAGGIPGVFHGPLWLYLNLPAYIFGKGNPLVVAWFWYLLHLTLLFIIFWIAKTMFDKKVAWWAVAIAATQMTLDVHSYLNPQGAVLIFPIFFYLYWQYRQNKKWQYFVASLFLIGCLIQFEIAFGGPILLLVILDGIKNRRKDWWCYLILLIPLSSYILFELRHNFLQFRALTNFAGGGTVDFKRIVIGLVILPLLFIKTEGLGLFVYFWVGFWLISLLFKGQIWSWYWLPFMPIGYVLASKLLAKYKIILTLLIVWGLYKGYLDFKNYKLDPAQQDVSTWQTNRAAAEWIKSKTKGEFGYYVYTPDLYGYGPAYAVDYIIGGKRNEKMAETYLIMLPNVKENPYGWQNWRSGEVKINRPADEEIEFENGIRVERYILTPGEQKIKSNELMIKDAFFR